jgi:hypothetical protein
MDFVNKIQDAERKARSQSWAGIPFELCGSIAMPITLRMVNELTLIDNAFFTGKHPLWGDVFTLLWRVHPAYYRPYSARRFLDFPACTRLRRHCQNMAAETGEPLRAAVSEINAFLNQAYADSPAGDASPDESPLRTIPHFLDSVIDWAGSRYGWSHAQVLDLPIACVFQLRRASAIAVGETIIDPSHAEIQHRLKHGITH